MLFFLDFARRSGVIVTSYEDEADGVMEKGDDGRMRITRVTLRPRIVFSGDEPDAAALDALHHKAHEACFIANSVTTEVMVEPRRMHCSPAKAGAQALCVSLDLGLRRAYSGGA